MPLHALEQRLQLLMSDYSQQATVERLVVAECGNGSNHDSGDSDLD
jgi:hypothetical protein